MQRGGDVDNIDGQESLVDSALAELAKSQVLPPPLRLCALSRFLESFLYSFLAYLLLIWDYMYHHFAVVSPRCLTSRAD